MNALTMMNTCVRMDAEDDVLQQACTKTEGSLALDDFYDHIAEMNPAFFSASTKCPDMTKPSHFIFIMANILQVVTLTPSSEGNGFQNKNGRMFDCIFALSAYPSYGGRQWPHIKLFWSNLDLAWAQRFYFTGVQDF